MTGPMDIVVVPGYPRLWARRCIVDAWIDAGRPPLDGAGRTKEQQQIYWERWQNGTGNAADNPNANTRQPHVRGMALDLLDQTPSPDVVARMHAAGFVRPITRRAGKPWADGRGGFSQDEAWHFELKRYVDTIKTIPKVSAATARAAAAYTTPPTVAPIRKRKRMSVGVIYTTGKDKAGKPIVDRTRSGAVVDTESGFVHLIGWFPPSYADGIAVGFGLAKAAPVTQGTFDALTRDVAAMKGIPLSGEITVVGESEDGS